MAAPPKPPTLDLFKADLWKDQRKLEALDVNGCKCLAKYFSHSKEAGRESETILYLSTVLSRARVPNIVCSESDRIVFSYIRGIRLFNLFVELDHLEPPVSRKGQYLKQRLLARCEEEQKEIQTALISLPSSSANKPYPAVEKIRVVVQILADALGIVVKWEALDAELRELDDLWTSFATVPFRDATTKNMVLAAPSLWLGEFDSEESRRQALLSTLTPEGPNPDWFDAPIFNFDFASCVDNSTLEDDPISLLFHERTWNGPPVSAERLIWNGRADACRAAVTFLVRYYRFGGRKAAYRLLHPWGHRVRFRHDNDTFYFARLPGIMQHLWPESARKFRELLTFTSTVTRSFEGIRPDVDHFMAAGLAETRLYYTDMYPQ
jgi:hypothetical protein